MVGVDVEHLRLYGLAFGPRGPGRQALAVGHPQGVRGRGAPVSVQIVLGLARSQAHDALLDHQRVGIVDLPVPVDVPIAQITDAVGVEVALAGIEHSDAVVGFVGHPVLVLVAAHPGHRQIAQPDVVPQGLSGPRRASPIKCPRWSYWNTRAEPCPRVFRTRWPSALIW